MKTNNRLRKIRYIIKTEKMPSVGGVVLPPHIIDRWLGVYVRVIEDGDKIILQSGALPTPLKKMEIRNISKRLEVVRI